MGAGGVGVGAVGGRGGGEGGRGVGGDGRGEEKIIIGCASRQHTSENGAVLMLEPLAGELSYEGRGCEEVRGPRSERLVFFVRYGVVYMIELVMSV